MAKKRAKTDLVKSEDADYRGLLSRIAALLEQGRQVAARTANAVLTATYWEVGRQIVEFEQGGQPRAAYGEVLWKRLATDLTARYGRGFSKSNLASMRAFYLGWQIFQTPSGKWQARVKSAPPPGESPGEKGPAAPAALQPSVVTQLPLPLDSPDALLDAFPL
jgi:hypothetical protein